MLILIKYIMFRRAAFEYSVAGHTHDIGGFLSPLGRTRFRRRFLQNNQAVAVPGKLFPEGHRAGNTPNEAQSWGRLNPSPCSTRTCLYINSGGYSFYQFSWETNVFSLLNGRALILFSIPSQLWPNSLPSSCISWRIHLATRSCPDESVARVWTPTNPHRVTYLYTLPYPLSIESSLPKSFQDENRDHAQPSHPLTWWKSIISP